MTLTQSVNVRDFGATGAGKVLDTAAIQAAIEHGAKKQLPVLIPKGVYLVGSLFLQTSSHLQFEEGATLLGSTEITDYPEIFARVAGVEMLWPAAVLNAINVTDITISGNGIIDGQGPFWWDLYWGADQKGGLRAEYDQNNQRWIADYAIKRPRACLFYEAKNVTIQDITFQRSGFWNLQLTYCKDVLVQNVKVKDNHGPSTDGIDIDSSENVRITQCQLSCGDDCIVVKSGRDGDGLRVNRIAKNIEIDHCQILSGYGITLGSEVSGGIRHVYIHDNTFTDSDCGLRMKSAKERGGFITDIHVENLTMHNVLFPFSWIMNWHTAYNKKIFADLTALPPSWQAVAAQIPEEKQGTAVQRITVKNVSATLDADYPLPARAFDLVALPEKPMTAITFENCKIAAKEFGRIEAINDLVFDNVQVSVASANETSNDLFDNR